MNEISPAGQDNTWSKIEEELLKSKYTPDEVLLGKSIFIEKARKGLVSRVCAFGIKNAPDDQTRLFYTSTCDVADKINSQYGTVAREIASRLGISEQRYRELADFIYEHERNI